ncbi:MAG: OmpA family protein [Rhodobiaceae bacterium]|nr:OmpA family protein [Rhodobiaceae bacterium]
MRVGLGQMARAMALGIVGLALAGCASLVDDARDMNPQGSAFQQALYEHYVDLAVGRDDNWNSDEGAEFYAKRAIEAANGVDVAPAPVPSGVAATADLQRARDRLLAAFAQGGKEELSDLMARAQVAYDCWAYEMSQGAPSVQVYQCRARFLTLMGRIEVDLAPEAVPVAAALPDEANFIVYFGFDEWFLSAEALEVLSAAIDRARTDGHSRIIAGGHTDTKGPADYNDGLSVQRAEIVKITLVEMGALPGAVEIIGYGESRLAIETGDGVREPLNRRTVVTLLP